ncbi:uncharacterized protein M421DRAFT_399130 [Didymella exigua CBS 183.55]|uniref:Uncharacterized protein n=1 Tax=Didymella exigua CBS 183.55 TaxID=1150837 RepID=A0A6A5S2K3_9PLEO|nr:uncharacterized protein M421DRAFT_399130 [Didymella exigua CBS 183.55]KAF1932706.1 hypothetical protein M421DRAFT_399130 [Didymella exigua CBS 183.55]
MMDIVGALGAGSTIRIKNSRRDIEELASETIIFAGLYKKFLRACDDDRDAYTTDALAVRSLITWATRTADSLRQLLRKVEALYPQSKSSSKLEKKAISHIVWLGSKSAVKALRDSLSVARESINGFSNLMCLKKLKKQIKSLKSALHDRNKRLECEAELGTTLEAKIREIDQDIKETEVLHRENRKVLGKAEHKVARHRQNSRTADLVPAPEQLYDLIEILDDYAHELFPSRCLRKRTDDRSSVSSASGHGSVYSPLSQRSQRTSASDPLTSGTIRTHNSSIPTSSASSLLSFRSPLNPPRFSSSLSTVSTSSVDIPNLTSPSNVQANVSIECAHTRREYMRDPKGNILSPPIVRSPSSPATTIQIGDHLITLEATKLKINRHSLDFNDYEMGLSFFEALRQHPREVDSLNEVLARGDEDWEGIPGWLVNPSEWIVQPPASGVRDV